MLLAGLVIYVLFYPTAYAAKAICSVLPMPTVHAPNSLAVRILRNYGADFLWSAAFVTVMQTILFLPKKKIPLLLICGLLGAIYEGMQFCGIVKGTADMLDIPAYLIGTVFGIIFILGGQLYETR